MRTPNIDNQKNKKCFANWWWILLLSLEISAIVGFIGWVIYDRVFDPVNIEINYSGVVHKKYSVKDTRSGREYYYIVFKDDSTSSFSTLHVSTNAYFGTEENERTTFILMPSQIGN